MSEVAQLLPEINKAASLVAWRWPTVVTLEDLAQDICIRLLESPGSVDKLIEMETGARIKNLTRIANQIASAERDDYEVFSGNYRYSVNEVRTLLEAGVLKRSKVSKFTPAMTDLLDGFDSLALKNSDQVEVIYQRYILDQVPKNSSSIRKVLNRAVEALTREMNRSRKSDEYEHTNGGRR